MTVTATLAGAISMLANFGLFFGGRRRPQQPAGRRRHDRHGDPRAARRNGGADGDQPRPRSSRPTPAPKSPAVPTLASALETGLRGGAHRQCRCRAQPATAHMFIVNPCMRRASTACSPTTCAPSTGCCACAPWPRRWGLGGRWRGGRADAVGRRTPGGPDGADGTRLRGRRRRAFRPAVSVFFARHPRARPARDAGEASEALAAVAARMPPRDSSSPAIAMARWPPQRGAGEVLGRYIKQPLPAHGLAAAGCLCGAAELDGAGGQEPCGGRRRQPAGRRDPQAKPFKPLINAVLRRVAAEARRPGA